MGGGGAGGGVRVKRGILTTVRGGGGRRKRRNSPLQNRMESIFTQEEVGGGCRRFGGSRVWTEIRGAVLRRSTNATLFEGSL